MKTIIPHLVAPSSLQLLEGYISSALDISFKDNEFPVINFVGSTDVPLISEPVMILRGLKEGKYIAKAEYVQELCDLVTPSTSLVKDKVRMKVVIGASGVGNHAWIMKLTQKWEAFTLLPPHRGMEVLMISLK